MVKEFISKELTKQKQELLQRVEDEVIQEDEKSVHELVNEGKAVVFAAGTDNPQWTYIRNTLRVEQRQALKKLQDD